MRVATARSPFVWAVDAGDRQPLFVATGRIVDAADAPAAKPDTLWRVYSDDQAGGPSPPR